MAGGIHATYKLRCVPEAYGIGSIPMVANINGQVGDLMADYTGDKGAAGGWPSNNGAGPTLSLTGSGADPNYLVPSPGNTTQDFAVDFNNGKTFQATDGGAGVEVGSEDMLGICIFRDDPVGGVGYNALAKKLPADLTAGWSFYVYGAGLHFVAFYPGGGPFLVQNMGQGTFGSGLWRMVVFALDQNEASYGFHAWKGEVTPAALVRYGPYNKGNTQSFATSAVFGIGCTQAEFANGISPIAMFRLWSAPSWFAGGTTGRDQIEAFVQQCYNAWVGA